MSVPMVDNYNKPRDMGKNGLQDVVAEFAPQFENQKQCSVFNQGPSYSRALIKHYTEGCQGAGFGRMADSG
jgi:hypothetical protein